MTSINTNIAATTALRTLQQTNAQLDQTQGRISTGLKIGSAKDNAAYWSISTALKSDNKSMAAVKDALNLGAGAVDVAYQGLTKAKEVLDDFQSKLTSALSPNADRRAVQDNIASYQEALRSIAGTSFFSGENWLTVDTATTGTDRKVVASFSRDANNQVTVGTLDVDLSRIALFDGAEGGILGKQVALRAGGEALLVGGNDGTGTAPTVTGVTPTNTPAQTGSGADGPAVASLGTFSATGLDTTDRIQFGLSINGATPATTITVNLANVTNGATFEAAIQQGLTDASITGVTADVDAGTGAITLTSTANGSTQTLAVTNVVALDGDGNTTSALGLQAKTPAGAESGSAGTAAVYDTGAAFNAAGLRAGDRISFEATLVETGGSAVVRTITIETTAGMDETAFLAAINAQLSDATNGFGANKVTAGLAGGTGTNLIFTTTATGANTSFDLANVTTTDGDGTDTALGGLTAGSGQGTSATAAAAGFSSIALPNASSFTGSAELSFTVAVDGGTARTVLVNRATVDAVLPNANGAIADQAAWASVLTRALSDAQVTGVTATVNAGGTAVELAKASGTTGGVVVAGLTANGGPDTVSVGEIDITSTAFNALTRDQQLDAINAYISVVRSALTEVTSAAANLGSVASRIESQQSFVDTLMDTIDKGISGLIDADMNEESTRLQALQVKQQLGVQALSIANQSAQNVLRLFQ